MIDSHGYYESAGERKRNRGASSTLRVGRKTFPRGARRTADPSTTLRSGRDDKGEGSASIQIGCAGDDEQQDSQQLKRQLFCSDRGLKAVPFKRLKRVREEPKKLVECVTIGGSGSL
jgi:hypothetical protein